MTTNQNFINAVNKEKEDQLYKVNSIRSASNFGDRAKLFKALLKVELEQQSKNFGHTIAESWASREAVDLLLITAYIESDFRHIKQIPIGIALSYYQVEPNTARDVYQNFAIYRNQFKKVYEKSILIHKSLTDALLNSFDFSTLCARLVYYRQPFKLKSRNQYATLEAYAHDLALIHKQYFNTFLGATNVDNSTKKAIKVLRAVNAR